MGFFRWITAGLGVAGLLLSSCASTAAAEDAATSAKATLSESEIKLALGEHNRVRKDVGVGPMTWSGPLAAYASAWADHLAASGCRMEHRPRDGNWKQRYGENIFMGTAGYFDVASAVKSWESEKKFYRGQALGEGNWYQAGHYTQIVWRSSTKLGCGQATCKGNLIVVCNYDPAGNMLGQKPY